MSKKLLYSTTSICVVAATTSVFHSSVSAKNADVNQLDTTEIITAANWAKNVTITPQPSSNHKNALRTQRDIQ